MNNIISLPQFPVTLNDVSITASSILHQHDQYFKRIVLRFSQQTIHRATKLVFIHGRYYWEKNIAFLKRFHILQFEQIKL